MGCQLCELRQLHACQLCQLCQLPQLWLGTRGHAPAHPCTGPCRGPACSSNNQLGCVHTCVESVRVGFPDQRPHAWCHSDGVTAMVAVPMACLVYNIQRLAEPFQGQVMVVR